MMELRSYEEQSDSDGSSIEINTSRLEQEEPKLGPAPIEIVKKYQDRNEIVVDQGSDFEGVHHTINSALAVATEGGIICVFPGTYNETLAITSKVTIRGTNWDHNHYWKVEVRSDAGNTVRCQAKGVVLQGLEIVEKCNYKLPSRKEEFGQSPCCIGVSGENSVSIIECVLHGHGTALLSTGSGRAIMKSCRLIKPPDQQTSFRFSAIICLHTSDVYIENCEFKYVRAPLVTCLHRSRCTIRESDLVNCNSHAVHASDSATLMIEKCNLNENAFSAVYCDGSSAALLKECLIQGNGNGVTCREESRVVVQACSIKECGYCAVSCSKTSSCDLTECRIDNVLYAVNTSGQSRAELKGCQIRNSRGSSAHCSEDSVVTLRVCDIKHSHTVFTGTGNAVMNTVGCHISYTRHDVVKTEGDSIVTMKQTTVDASALGKRRRGTSGSGTVVSRTTEATEVMLSERTYASGYSEFKNAKIPVLSIAGSLADVEQQPYQDKSVLLRPRESVVDVLIDQPEEAHHHGVNVENLLLPESPNESGSRRNLATSPIMEEDEEEEEEPMSTNRSRRQAIQSRSPVRKITPNRIGMSRDSIKANGVNRPTTPVQQRAAVVGNVSVRKSSGEEKKPAARAAVTRPVARSAATRTSMLRSTSPLIKTRQNEESTTPKVTMRRSTMTGKPAALSAPEKPAHRRAISLGSVRSKPTSGSTTPTRTRPSAAKPALATAGRPSLSRTHSPVSSLGSSRSARGGASVRKSSAPAPSSTSSTTRPGRNTVTKPVTAGSRRLSEGSGAAKAVPSRLRGQSEKAVPVSKSSDKKGIVSSVRKTISQRRT